MKKENDYPNNKGRKPKADPCTHRYAFHLNNSDNERFLKLFEMSGMKNRAHFITACLFNKPIKVVKLDKGILDYYMRLTTFYSQFRAIGINYNQVTKSIKFAFTDKKALAFLYKLEKATYELVVLNQKIIALTQEFEKKIHSEEQLASDDNLELPKNDR